MSIAQGADSPLGNRDFPWDEFSPEEYFKYNYVNLRDDDREIVEKTRDFFAKTFAAAPLPPHAQGIDVGTGSNLYPALAMLPFCETITLYEHSASNVEWLQAQCAERWPSWSEAWGKFWEILCEEDFYRNVGDPRLTLSERVDIVQADVLNLATNERWDTGTMFFVAESITNKRDEFEDAVDHFFAMLKPAAPFAMAFMEHSEGYHVGHQDFPATDIGQDDVRECLEARADGVELHRLGPGDRPLREHYTGMIVAHGFVKHAA